VTAPIAPLGDFQLPSIASEVPEVAEAGKGGGGGFGAALMDQLDKLSASQADASNQAQALATGKANDVTSVVMAVEKASLELQLATQIRNKGVEAYQEIFRMAV
jgi:flagellar hook-basal body complex protein FliE